MKSGGRLTMAGADASGAYYGIRGWQPAVRSGLDIVAADSQEWIDLPPGATVQFLPERVAVGFPRGSSPDEPALPLPGQLPVAVQLPSGYCRTRLPAYQRVEGAGYLPFFGFTAAAFRGDRLVCAALQTDTNPHWDPSQYGGRDLTAIIEARRRASPDNRILGQLQTCALEYGCYNAQNIFYERWEGAVPVSPACNAVCVGCISMQPDDMPESPQKRFNFVPTAEEIIELGLRHLDGPEDRIYSFGQGCEGEPLLQGPLIARCVRELRAQTDRGTIHLNTNASRPEAVRAIVEAGLDSMRVSLNSVDPARYEAYYQPKRYRFADLIESIRIARGAGVKVSLNLLHLPGWNDRVEEHDALLRFLREHDVNLVQMRNLNIDPDLYARSVSIPGGPCLGVAHLVESIRAAGVKVGNHTPTRHSY